MRLLAGVATIIGLFAAVACSGGGTKTPAVTDTTSVAATAEALSFDPNVFTAIALQPSEVPTGLAFDGRFYHFNQGVGIEYSSSYTDGNFAIQTIIGRHADEAERQNMLVSLRTVLTGLLKTERNNDVAGADQAFIYGNVQSPGAATMTIVGDYYISMMVQSTDGARLTEAQDQDTLQTYTKLVFDRLTKYIADPSSVTPLPGGPRYDPAAPGTAPVTGPTPAAN